MNHGSESIDDDVCLRYDRQAASHAGRRSTRANFRGNHTEQQLRAYVFGKFKENGLMDVKIEAEKMPVLAALSLVGCIAETAAPMTE